MGGGRGRAARFLPAQEGRGEGAGRTGGGLASTEGQVDDLAFPIFFGGMPYRFFNAGDGAPRIEAGGHVDQSRHGDAGLHAFIRCRDHRSHVVRQEDAALLCSPSKDGGVRHASQTGVLSGEDVPARIAEAQLLQDRELEILVGDEPGARVYSAAGLLRSISVARNAC